MRYCGTLRHPSGRIPPLTGGLLGFMRAAARLLGGARGGGYERLGACIGLRFESEVGSCFMGY